MKRILISLALVATLAIASNGYAETNSPVKAQTEMFVHSLDFP
jgi:hypothetical protein